MSSTNQALLLAWCSHDAALFAVKRWHYSQSLPTPPIVKVGVWESGDFVGVVLFSRGASGNLGKPFSIVSTQLCELTRVALKHTHKSPVSRIVSIAMRLMLKKNPGLRLVLSFADTAQGHHGGIYQAGNWTYCGLTAPSHEYIDALGRKWHSRQVSEKGINKQYGQLRRVPRPSECKKVCLPAKHRYAMPLDDAMRKVVESMRKPYPKRLKHSSDAVSFQDAESGAIPT